MGENMKQLKARVVHKHKTAAEWYLDVYKSRTSTEKRDDPFIPLDGELIIFDGDSIEPQARIKKGDGVTDVWDLPFITGTHIINTGSITPLEAASLIERGDLRNIWLIYDDPTYGQVITQACTFVGNNLLATATINVGGTWIAYEIFGDLQYNYWGTTSTPLAQLEALSKYTFMANNYNDSRPRDFISLFQREDGELDHSFLGSVSIVFMYDDVWNEEKIGCFTGVQIHDITNNGEHSCYITAVSALKDDNGKLVLASLTGDTVENIWRVEPIEEKKNADWNELDSSSSAYIVNKPFGDMYIDVPKNMDYSIPAYGHGWNVVGWTTDITQPIDASKYRILVHNYYNMAGIDADEWVDLSTFAETQTDGAVVYGYYTPSPVNGLIYLYVVSDPSVFSFRNTQGTVTEPGLYYEYFSTESFLGDENYEFLFSSSSIKAIEKLETVKLDNKYLNTSLEVGKGNASIQQTPDGVANGFDFTGKNAKATALDSTLTGTIPYGATGEFATAFGGKSAAIGKRAFAEGTTTIAKGKYSHAEGDNSVALGNDSHAEGLSTTSAGNQSHAEGSQTTAEGRSAHAEGYLAEAVGDGAHAEGHKTLAQGDFSHAQGNQTQALGPGSAAAGYKTTAGYTAQFVIGHVNDNKESSLFEIGNGRPYYKDGNSSTGEVIDEKSFKFNSFEVDVDGVTKSESFATKSTISNKDTFNIYDEGNQPIIIPGSVASGLQSVAFGQSAEASGDASFAQGLGVKAAETNQAVFGKYNAEDSDALFIVGNGANETSKSNAFQVMANGTIQAPKIQQAPDGVKDGFDFTGKNANATALDNTLTGKIAYGATGQFASAFGGKSAAMGKRSHAEGTTTIAKGNYSHVEGDNSVTLGADSHAEGFSTVAYGYASHAEGGSTQAKGDYSHAEGYFTVAQGSDSHAEGANTVATGHASHAGGHHSNAEKYASFAHGDHVTATAENQVVFGKYNSNVENALFIIGNGTGSGDEHNILELTESELMIYTNESGINYMLDMNGGCISGSSDEEGYFPGWSVHEHGMWCTCNQDQEQVSVGHDSINFTFYGREASFGIEGISTVDDQGASCDYNFPGYSGDLFVGTLVDTSAGDYAWQLGGIGTAGGDIDCRIDSIRLFAGDANDTGKGLFITTGGINITTDYDGTWNAIGATNISLGSNYGQVASSFTTNGLSLFDESYTNLGGSYSGSTTYYQLGRIYMSGFYYDEYGESQSINVGLNFPYEENGYRTLATREWVSDNAVVLDGSWINIESEGDGGLCLAYSDDSIEYSLYNISYQWYDSDVQDYQHAYFNFPTDKTGAQLIATREWVMEYIASL